MRRGGPPDLPLTKRTSWLEMRSGAALAAVTIDGGAQDPERRELGRKQDHHPGHLKREEFGLFRSLLGRIPWDTALERSGVQESCLVSKDHLRAKERTILTGRKRREVVRALHG